MGAGEREESGLSVAGGHSAAREHLARAAREEVAEERERQPLSPPAPPPGAALQERVPEERVPQEQGVPPASPPAHAADAHREVASLPSSEAGRASPEPLLQVASPEAPDPATPKSTPEANT